MKRRKFESVLPLCRLRLIQFLMGILFLYLLFMSFEIPFVFTTGSGPEDDDSSIWFLNDAVPKHLLLEMEPEHLDAASRPSKDSVSSHLRRELSRTPEQRMQEFKMVSGLLFNESMFDDMDGARDEFLVLHKSAKQAWVVGRKVWEELRSAETRDQSNEEKEIGVNCKGLWYGCLKGSD